jgi:hypothetical protein
MSDDPKCVKIRIEFTNGQALEAEKDAAEDIWKWWLNCESMMFIHGGNYKGRGTLMTAHPSPTEPAPGSTKEPSK